MLCEEDILRVGRCKFRVKELNTNYNPNDMKNFSLCDMISACNDENESSEENPHEETKNYILPCRICLHEQYDHENPLISPCKCGGTMKYIHLKCLQQCLMSKLTTKSSENVLSFSWKKLGCDLCKKNYPYKLNIGGRTVELLDIPKPPGQYLILEELCKEKGSNKGLHVIHMGSKRTIKVGRAQDCELRFSDISVSRNHARINYIGEKFYFEDTGGKFGTLVQVKRPVLIEEDANLTLQSGRSLITYSVKLPWSLIPSCFRARNDLFEGVVSTRNMPIMPINTGIPLGVSDPYKLLSYAGIAVPGNNEKYKKNQNLLYEHNQLGANSSFEGEDEDPIEDIEEVEVAENGESNLCEETGRYDIDIDKYDNE